jgi:hypothetical protein
MKLIITIDCHASNLDDEEVMQFMAEAAAEPEEGMGSGIVVEVARQIVENLPVHRSIKLTADEYTVELDKSSVG